MKAPLAGVAAATVGMALAAGAAPATAATAVAHGGHVRAVLSWQRAGIGGFDAANIRVTISRRGTVALRDARVGRGRFPWMIFKPTRTFAPVDVVDLDGDREPEVLVSVFSGGAYCCTETRVYRWDGRGYAASPLYDFGEAGYRLQRFGRDVELVGAFPSWNIVPSAHADGGYPIQIWRQTARGLGNASREHPAQLAHDASYWRREQARRPGEGRSSVGPLAAYVVDLDRLGRSAEADAAIDAADASGELGELSAAAFRAGVGTLLRQVDASRPPYAPRDTLR